MWVSSIRFDQDFGIIGRSALFLRKAAFLAMAVFLWLTLGSCNRPTERADDVLLARVYDSHLYQGDIIGLVPPGSSADDSVALMKRYVDRWVRQQVFLHQALKNLDVDQIGLEKKIEDYRNSLIIFAYENELIRQKLDTLVTEQQVAEYYEENQDNFKLRENIVKVMYVKVPLDAPEVWRLRRLYRSENPDDLVQLEDYSLQHAATYYLESDTWLFFNDLLREIPIQTNNQEAYLRANRYVEITDNYFRYFLNIVDYRLKGGVSPLVLERDNIRSMLLNKRRHAFINEQRGVFFQEAVRDGRLDILP